MKKSFKLTHKPGHVLLPPAPLAQTSPEVVADDPRAGSPLAAETLRAGEHRRSMRTTHRSSATIREARPTQQKREITTRKTIEVPEEHFFQVKMRALQRRIKEKDLWAEILEEYFTRHPE